MKLKEYLRELEIIPVNRYSYSNMNVK